MQVIKVIPLTDKWSLKPTAATAKSTARTTVEPVNDFSIPAEVHMLLQRQLNVKDWHYRYNDTEYRWIGKMDWEFSRLLPSLQHCQQQGTVVLLDMRVDTVATITIDSDRQSSAIEPVGTVNNMFVRYRFDISKWYNTADEWRSPPTLTIRVHSPSGTARLLHDSYPYDIPDDYVPELQGEPHRNFIRKQQCSFGWDWGPCFLNSALLHCQLLCIPPKSVKIDDLVPIVTKLDGKDQWEVQLKFWLIAASMDLTGLSVEAKVIAPDGSTVGHGKFDNELDASLQGSVQVHVCRPQLWWPNGYGDQPLYTVQLSIADNVTGTAEQVVDSVQKIIAFRKIQLVQQLDAAGNGSCFRFDVNDRPMFAKGANFIPADAFNTRMTAERLEQLLQNAIDANMNMLRVWGGGLYQPDEFYDYCDRNGILVWQEFMFACAMYPTNETFLSSVRTEVEQQVKRLAHHPCICLWSGNNENEEALVTAWYEPVRKNPYIFTVDYHRLYHETIMPAVCELDPSRAFISSSPSNGIITNEPFTERYKVDQPHLYGDTHYYNYRDLGTVISRYPKCRFASEYGFQAFPSWQTYSRISEPEDWHPFSAFNIQRNHHRNGQPELLHQMHLLFDNVPFPDAQSSKCSPAMFENYCLLTQIVQVLCIKAQTEHYRRLMGQNMFCMGALYWQFNDIWEAPSWAGIECGGGWKLLHNSIKDIFQPLWVSGFFTANGGLEIHLSNDSTADHAVDCAISFWRYSTNCKAEKQIINGVVVKSMSSIRMALYETTDMIGPLADLVVEVECFNAERKQLLCRNVIFPQSFHGSQLSKPAISIVPEKEGGQIVFKVSTDRIAPFVCLEEEPISRGRFHPNGFTLFPGNPPTTVSYHSFKTACGVDLPPSDIKIKTLFDVLNC